MSKTTDKTEIILPIINKALENAKQQPAEVLQDGGVPCLYLPSGARCRIHQLGALTPAMLPVVIGDSFRRRTVLSG